MPARMTLKELELFLDGKEPEVALQFLLSVRSQYGSSLDRLINKYEKLREKELLEIERYRNMCRYEAEARQQGFVNAALHQQARSGRAGLAGVLDDGVDDGGDGRYHEPQVIRVADLLHLVHLLVVVLRIATLDIPRQSRPDRRRCRSALLTF